MKKCTALLLAILLFLSGCSQRPEPREANVIIREMINTYAEEEDADSDALKALREELEHADPEKAGLWGQILDFWIDCDQQDIHEGALSAGLPQDDTLCLVVLGFELNSDGTMQEELVGRLETALHCAEQYPNALVLCTGGGTAARAPEVTEAGLMGEWLLSHGLESERLLVEDRSRSTVENALYSRLILRQEQSQVRSLAIISSSYHIVWGSVMFESALLLSQEGEEDGIHVISHAAFPFVNPNYADTRAYIRSQLLSLLR